MNWYDFVNRMYDPQLGRFTSIDAYAEAFSGFSPFSYGCDNPMVYVDPDGNFSTRFGAWLYKIFNGGGEILQDKGGEYFVGQQVSNQGDADITYKRSFDWGGRGEGKDIAFEDQKEAFLIRSNVEENFRQAHFDYNITNAGEFINSNIGLAGNVLMPNPVLKSANALVGGEKVAEEGVTALDESVNVVSIVRSRAEKVKYLKSLAENGKYPKWMNQWLTKGKVPPGYNVEHIKPLSIGGVDAASNMRLNTISNHRLIHKYYHPWRK